MDQHFSEKSIVHMFLPKRTPDSQNDDLPKTEDDILIFVTDSFLKGMENNNFVQELTSVLDMLKKWLKVQPKKSIVDQGQIQINEIRTTLKNLEVGDTIPIYVRQQNSTMLISKFGNPNEEKTRVQTFRASLPAETVMSNVESLKMNFPETTNLIGNVSLLTSNVFASHLSEMTVEEFAESTVNFESGRKKHIKIRDAPKPILVSDWTVGNLVPRPDADGPMVTKKIRDQVTLPRKSSEETLLLPFRRSGMWMSIKVALHLKILQIFNNDQDTAKLVYKLIILCFLTDACKFYEIQKDRLDFDLDLAYQMAAKVGRRVKKLQGLACGISDDTISIRVELMRSTVLEYILKLLTSFNQTNQNLWNKVITPAEPTLMQPVKRSTEDFRKDLVHTISPLDDFLEKSARFTEPHFDGTPDMKSIKTQFPKSLESSKKIRFTTKDSILSAINPIPDKFQELIWLHDVESFIKGIKDVDVDDFTSQDIFDIGQRYIAVSREAYDGNPIGIGQLMLVSLKLTRILDTIATKQHPLVASFKPDIDPELFGRILLPFERDMELLNDLSDYFNSRNSKGFHPILERDVDRNTLSVQFAKQNSEMIKLRQRIQRDIDIATEYKIKDVELVRTLCLPFQESLNVSSCSCSYEWREEKLWSAQAQAYLESERKGHKVKVSTCDFCNNERSLASLKTSVPVYEEPLPRSINLQYSIVFELRIPKEISHLRQFLAILKYELLGEPILNDGRLYDHVKDCFWLDFPELKYYKDESAENASTSVIKLGTLEGSSKPPVIYQPDVLRAKVEDFIVPNEMQCTFFYIKQRPSVENFQENCSFSLDKTFQSEPYLSLAKYFSSTGHTQNEVLANQSDCHPKLSRDEFITFGSLRAGHRIQLWNLYHAIFTGNLSLENEPVLALILQTIWQVGPRSQNWRREREAHQEFQINDEFAMEFLVLLEKKSNEAKYSTPLVLLTAIVITTRIMDLNEKCQEKCYRLLKEWRKLTHTWISEIDAEISKSCNAYDVMFKNKMHNIQSQIITCSLLTYHGQRSNTCMDDEDVAHFLHTITRKHLLNKEYNSGISGFMNVLRFMEQMIPVALKLDLQASGGILRFINEKFPSIREQNYVDSDITISFEPIESNLVTVQFGGEFFIGLDVFTGELLINSYPEVELSSQISGNIEFRRFFQKCLNFRLERVSSTVLQTKYPFHGKHYQFRINDRFELEEMIEIQEDNNLNLVFVPRIIFRGHLNDHFIDNYTHWMDPRNKEVHFRRIAAKDKDYDLPHEYKLTKTPKGFKEGWLFHDEINKQFLISKKSDGFSQLAKPLLRFELPQFIYAFMDSKMTVAGTRLPRHNLKFTMQCNGLLESFEYPGFQVSLNPNSAGTFLGLENTILLQNGPRRKIIIPHGRIKINEKNPGSMHHTCEIDLKTLSDTPFYIYELDDVLKRLVAKRNVSSWLYLAALHAITSSCRPDPFTGMTGTEMAVNILQSALVWSCSPYDKEQASPWAK